MEDDVFNGMKDRLYILRINVSGGKGGVNFSQLHLFQTSGLSCAPASPEFRPVRDTRYGTLRGPRRR